MKRASNEKNNGIFHTPKELAQYVTNLAINRADSTVLDPCYGEGSLLLAAHQRLLDIGCNEPYKYLSGYDIIPPTGDIRETPLGKFLNRDNLTQRDFFTPPNDEPEDKFDVILMNPPFVRHHLIPKDTQGHLQRTIAHYASLPMTSDLWAYFVIHSSNFLRENGSLAAILPWSFLRADYARPVREFLIGRFSILRVEVIGQRLFERAEERVLVVLAKGFGCRSSEIGIHYSSEIPTTQTSWMSVERDTWLESPWDALVSGNMRNVFSNVSDSLGFEPISHFAKIRIGTVTGANSFFILGREVARSMRLPEGMLMTIIKHSNDLGQFTISASDGIDDVLLLIPEDIIPSEALQKYIEIGKKNGLDDRYHTNKRAKWYSIPKQISPDAFLPYMTKEIPFLVFNPEGFLSTNSVHGVYFLDGVDEQTKKWIQLSMLTSISQLSVELVARTYGGGVLKIEPSAVSAILVYPGHGHPFPTNLEHELNNLLLAGKRLEAVNRADSWVIANLGVPREDMNSIIECYQNLRRLRLGEGVGKSESLPISY